MKKLKTMSSSLAVDLDGSGTTSTALEITNVEDAEEPREEAPSSFTDFLAMPFARSMATDLRSLLSSALTSFFAFACSFAAAFLSSELTSFALVGQRLQEEFLCAFEGISCLVELFSGRFEVPSHHTECPNVEHSELSTNPFDEQLVNLAKLGDAVVHCRAVAVRRRRRHCRRWLG